MNIYRNKKHGGLYLLHGHAMDRTNGQKPRLMASYQSLYDGYRHVRDNDEFMKCFEKLSNEEKRGLFAPREKAGRKTEEIA